VIESRWYLLSEFHFSLSATTGGGPHVSFAALISVLALGALLVAGNSGLAQAEKKSPKEIASFGNAPGSRPGSSPQPGTGLAEGCR